MTFIVKTVLNLCKWWNSEGRYWRGCIIKDKEKIEGPTLYSWCAREEIQ